jgi:hypothetical protein
VSLRLTLMFTVVMVAPRAWSAYDYYINFKFAGRVEISEAERKSYHRSYDYHFQARNWNDALAVARSMLGMDYRTGLDPTCDNKLLADACLKSSLMITGIELVEGPKNIRHCTMGNMVRPPLRLCPLPSAKNKKPKKKKPRPPA